MAIEDSAPISAARGSCRIVVVESQAFNFALLPSVPRLDHPRRFTYIELDADFLGISAGSKRMKEKICKLRLQNAK